MTIRPKFWPSGTTLFFCSISIACILTAHPTWASNQWDCNFEKFCVSMANYEEDACQKDPAEASIAPGEDGATALSMQGHSFPVQLKQDISADVVAYLAKTNDKSFMVLTLYPDNSASMIVQTYLGAPWTSTRFGKCQPRS